jgi:hypothetical protein
VVAGSPDAGESSVTNSVKTEDRQFSFLSPEITYPINRGCGAISPPPESGVWPQKSYSPEIGGTYRVSPYMVVATAARTAPIPLTATTATTMPRADGLAADWLALVDRWRPQIVNYVGAYAAVPSRHTHCEASPNDREAGASYFGTRHSETWRSQASAPGPIAAVRVARRGTLPFVGWRSACRTG